MIYTCHVALRDFLEAYWMLTGFVYLQDFAHHVRVE